MRPTDELLYDSEASLRLVDRAIVDLSPRRERLESYSDTAATVVRFCQTAGILDRTRLEALQQMPWRVGDGTAAAEKATSDLVDSLRRSVALLDALDGVAGVTTEMRLAMSVAFRDELADVAAHLSTQHVSAEHRADIAVLVEEFRTRIADLTRTDSATEAA